MVARATKGFLRSVLRRVKPAELDISCKIAVVSYFNLVLGDNSAAQYYWRTFLKPLVITRFGKCLTVCITSLTQMTKSMNYLLRSR